MSYWAGYAGSALVLTDREFDSMMEKYRTLNPAHAASVEDEYEDIHDCDRADLIRGTFAGQDLGSRGPDKPGNADLYFQPVKIPTDTCEGGTLTPFYHDGGKNLPVFDDEGGLVREPAYTVYTDDVWAFFSDRALDGVGAFDEKPYPSYQAFVDEFKAKLGAYLPGDFDWDAHLGRFSYACYA